MFTVIVLRDIGFGVYTYETLVLAQKAYDKWRDSELDHTQTEAVYLYSPQHGELEKFWVRG